MVARTFVINTLFTGGVTSFGLICEDARYASVRPVGSTRLVRRWVSAAGWKAILQELAAGREPGPLPSASALVTALTEET